MVTERDLVIAKQANLSGRPTRMAVGMQENTGKYGPSGKQILGHERV